MQVNEIVKTFIVEEILQDGRGANITDRLGLIESGIIDSMGMLRLLGFLEERFVIEIQGDELMPENFETIEKISMLVQKKMEQGKGD